MSSLEQLSQYLQRLEARLRVFVLSRGAALAMTAALVATILAVIGANVFAFSSPSVLWARVLVFLCLAVAIAFGLVLPLLRISSRNAARRAEQKCPALEERLLTFAEQRGRKAEDPFLELLAADTMDLVHHAEPDRVISRGAILASMSAAAVALGTLAWLVLAGPGFLGYGASLLWAGPSRSGIQPYYDVAVTPGNKTVRRGASQIVTARLVGFQSQRVRLFARYRSASKWEEALMQPQPEGPGYEFLFAGIPDAVDYYVEAGRVRSKTYQLDVIDLPAVKRIRVTYRFPHWTGLPVSVEDPGGDVRAVEGTEAEIAVQTDRPLANGVLVLDDGHRLELQPSKQNWRAGTMKLEKDGMYYVAAVENGETVRLSEDYFIEVRKDSEPSVKIVRPGRDARVSPIEEVTVAVSAADDFGLRELSLHYAANGGEEKTVSLLPRSGVRAVEGGTTLYLEDMKLVPGDLVSIYATAADARSSARTDIYFLEAQPFEREYSQSQQSGGGMGGVEDPSGRISARQKEIIAATWNQIRDRSGDLGAARENAKFLADIQGKLRDQAQSLSRRMTSRQLTGANQEFQKFAQDMQKASEAMNGAVEKLKTMQWRDALQPEQQALQHLLRAEATFRQIQVAFGSRGGGGGAGRMGRDLENLFDLELDTEKNQYETGQQAASPDQRAREIDEALQKLEQLARRQQELAEQRRDQQSFQQRWQQEMLRREAEQLQRKIEQLARGDTSQQGQSGQQGQSSQGGESSGSQASSSGSPQQQRLRAMARQGHGQVDPRIQQALERIAQATREMRRAGGETGGSPQSEAESRRAAERLQEARELLRGLRRQESSEQLDEMVRQGERLASQQQDLANRLRQIFGNQPQGSPLPGHSRQQAEELAGEKQQMLSELQRLERDMQSASRELAGTHRSASSKLREALGEMQKDELALRMRYSAEMMRRGLGQFMIMREAPITLGLSRLRDQLREAREALGREPGGSNDLERALNQVERLREQMARLSGQRGDQQGQGGQAGRQAGGQQPGAQGRQGQGGHQPGEGSMGQRGQGALAGPRGGGEWHRGQAATNFGEWQPADPGNVNPQPGDPAAVERLHRDAVRELSRLRQSVQDSPEVERDVQELIREIQRLDPRRYPGNPQLLERMRTELLPHLEQLELQLRRKLDEKQAGQVRSAGSERIPPGYADAVAEYFRRLSKAQ